MNVIECGQKNHRNRRLRKHFAYGMLQTDCTVVDWKFVHVRHQYRPSVRLYGQQISLNKTEQTEFLIPSISVNLNDL